jgi:hypothetical protein
MTRSSDPWPLIDNPRAEVELLQWCLTYRRMPDGSPLYPHAPDPLCPYPGELYGHYVTAGLAFTEATGLAVTELHVSMPFHDEETDQ